MGVGHVERDTMVHGPCQVGAGVPRIVGDETDFAHTDTPERVGQVIVKSEAAVRGKLEIVGYLDRPRGRALPAITVSILLHPVGGVIVRGHDKIRSLIPPRTILNARPQRGPTPMGIGEDLCDIFVGGGGV